MYTLLRVSKNYDGSASFAVADWSDSSVESLSTVELQKCLKMGFKIEGIEEKNGKLTVASVVPRKSGSSTITAIEDLRKLGFNDSMIVSYSYIDGENNLEVSFKADGEPYYLQGSIRNTVVSFPVEQRIRVPYYDRQKKAMVDGHAYTDYMQVSEPELLQTTSKNPIFKMTVSSMDKHFYGEDREEYFYKDYILEYRPKFKKFYYMGETPWRTRDGSEYAVVDVSRKMIVLNGSKQMIYRWI